MTKTFNIGDQVSVLDDAIDGVVVKVEKDQITIETTDNFLMTYFVNELIKINNTSNLDYFNKSDSLVKKISTINSQESKLSFKKSWKR